MKLLTYQDRPNFYVPTTCATCGGKCCKQSPGVALPEDFPEISVAALLPYITSGNWVVEHDTLTGSDLVRPRGSGDTYTSTYVHYAGRCVFLGPHGCLLSPPARPADCRMLEPRFDSKCVAHGQTSSMAKIEAAWRPYQEVLQGLYPFLTAGL